MQYSTTGHNDKTHRTNAPVPIKFGNDLSLWATWLYYEESLTQADIAAILGVSRASVVNYLAEARRNGLVSITLTEHLLTQVSTSQKLSRLYQLQDVYITPPRTNKSDDAISLRRQIGIAGACALSSLVNDTTVLGVASGRTMIELGKAMPTKNLRNASVIQVSGTSLKDELRAIDTSISIIASRLQASCYNLHAPSVVTLNDLRDALLNEPILKRHFARIRSCDTVVYSVGELTATTRMAEEEMLMKPLLKDYMDKGAVAILIGRLIDSNGRQINGPLSGRQIGIELEDLRNIPTRLCIAGGMEKLKAIRAVLTGGYVTHLVTDEITAKALLENAP